VTSDRTAPTVAGKSWTAEDLDVFRLAYDLSLVVHRASLEFPKIEQYGGLADQLRRASKSICSLIVEGVGRQTASSNELRSRDMLMKLAGERSTAFRSLITDNRSPDGSGAFRIAGEGTAARRPGGFGSANADMSNDKHCERQCRRKSKGSCVKLIFAGLAGP
jgi:23S rRNA-intervening sequence protein